MTVCLLEAGGTGKSIFQRAPIATAAVLPGYLKGLNWALKTEPQKHLNGRGGFQPRGRGLGGSSAINAMLYVRGHPSDYDEWEALARRAGRGRMYCRGSNHPSATRMARTICTGRLVRYAWPTQRAPRGITQAFIEAGAECQYPVNADFNGPSQEGVGLYQVTQFFGEGKNGERCSAAAAYLHPVMERKNLTVITGACASEVLFSGNRATVLPTPKDGETDCAGEARR